MNTPLNILNQIKTLVDKLDLDQHHQGWKAESDLDGIKRHITGIEQILGCPPDKSVCQSCLEYNPKQDFECSFCGEDFTR